MKKNPLLIPGLVASALDNCSGLEDYEIYKPTINAEPIGRYNHLKKEYPNKGKNVIYYTDEKGNIRRKKIKGGSNGKTS